MVMYDNEFKTKGDKIWTKDKIEPQHLPPENPCNIAFTPSVLKRVQRWRALQHLTQVTEMK